MYVLCGDRHHFDNFLLRIVCFCRWKFWFEWNWNNNKKNWSVCRYTESIACFGNAFDLRFTCGFSWKGRVYNAHTVRHRCRYSTCCTAQVHIKYTHIRYTEYAIYCDRRHIHVMYYVINIKRYVLFWMKCKSV